MLTKKKRRRRRKKGRRRRRRRVEVEEEGKKKYQKKEKKNQKENQNPCKNCLKIVPSFMPTSSLLKLKVPIFSRLHNHEVNNKHFFGILNVSLVAFRRLHLLKQSAQGNKNILPKQ